MPSPRETSPRGRQPPNAEMADSPAEIKREFSSAETDLSCSPPRNAARPTTVVGPGRTSTRRGGPAATDPEGLVRLPISNSASFQSHAGSDVSPSRLSDQYLLGAVKVVKWSAIGGSLLLTMKAVQMLFDNNFSLTIAFAICSGIILYSGFEGAMQQEVMRLSAFVTLAICIASFNLLEGAWILVWLGRFSRNVTPEAALRNFGTAKRNVVWYFSLQLLLAFASTAFWALSAYSGHRLSRLVKARRVETARQTHRRLARESITSQTSDPGPNRIAGRWPSATTDAITGEPHSERLGGARNSTGEAISSGDGEGNFSVEVELGNPRGGLTNTGAFNTRRNSLDQGRDMNRELDDIGYIVMGSSRLSELNEVTETKGRK